MCHVIDHFDVIVLFRAVKRRDALCKPHSASAWHFVFRSLPLRQKFWVVHAPRIRMEKIQNQPAARFQMLPCTLEAIELLRHVQ